MCAAPVHAPCGLTVAAGRAAVDRSCPAVGHVADCSYPAVVERVADCCCLAVAAERAVDCSDPVVVEHAAGTKIPGQVRFIHIFLLVALAVFVFNLIQGRRRSA